MLAHAVSEAVLPVERSIQHQHPLLVVEELFRTARHMQQQFQRLDRA